MNLLFDGKKAFSHLKALSRDIGPRHGGSENERRAARYIRDEFARIGLKASLFAYKTHTFASSDASLTVPGIGAVECLPVPCCASTPARGVTAKLVVLESGHEMLLDKSMRGAILMTLGGFGGKHYEAMMEVKPAGLIMVGNTLYRRPFRGKMGTDTIRKHGSVPMVHITYEDGLKILKKKPATCTLCVVTKGEAMGTSYCPVGELRGTEKPDEIIVVGGHYDSSWGAEGCQDNAGGTAVVMELARVFAKRGSKRTLRFMGFGGEEQGLCGSIAYVKKLKDKDDKLKKNNDFVRDGLKSELDRIVFMVNVDVQGTKLGTNSAWSCGHSDIAASARLLSSELARPFGVRENEVYSSDNSPFGKAGVPSISFARDSATTALIHTADDVIEHCDAEGMARAGEFIEHWMARFLAEAKSLPFPRTLPTVAKDKVNGYFGDSDPFKHEPQFPRKRYKDKPAKKSRKARRKK